MLNIKKNYKGEVLDIQFIFIKDECKIKDFITRNFDFSMCQIWYDFKGIESSKTIEMQFAVIDIEPTGGNATNNKIIEIAVVIHDGQKVIKTWESLINPELKDRERKRLIEEQVYFTDGNSSQRLANTILKHI